MTTIKSILISCKKTSLIILSIMVCLLAKAQPGWVDFTQYYNYTIVDKKGKPISFQSDKSFQIIIDSLSFSGNKIPQDSLIPAIQNHTMDFENYIRINDLAYRLPQKEHPTEIRIVHKNDTMAINQNTYGRYNRGSANRKSHRKLEFIPGYYYFPPWTSDIFDNPLKTEGQIRIENLNQKNFIITKKAYEKYAKGRFQEWRKMEKELNQMVVKNFLEGSLRVTKITQSTKLSPSMRPYRRPGWESDFYPTNDKDVYLGFTAYTLDTANQYISKNVFSEFNKSTNTITHWMPNPSIHQFYLGDIYFDVANGVLYQTSGIREYKDMECNVGWDANCPYKRKTFSSNDDGTTWKEDITFQQLFDNYDLLEFEFLDTEHALGFTRRKLLHSKGYALQQGTYYLIKNMEVIDSLKTPDDVHYNGNYNHYNFTRHGDTIALGPWGSEHYDYDKTYIQPLLIYANGIWDFKLADDTRKKAYAKTERRKSQKQFHHFTIEDKRKLVFNNLQGSLTLTRDIGHEINKTGISPNGVKVIEKDDAIYLIDELYTLVSFNAGLTWLIYPQPLNDRGRYHFLEIDNKYKITFFDLGKMEKNIFEFRPE